MLTTILLLASSLPIAALELPRDPFPAVDYGAFRQHDIVDPIAQRCLQIIRLGQRGLAARLVKHCAKAKRIDGFIDFGNNEGHLRPRASLARTLAYLLRYDLYDAQQAGAEVDAVRSAIRETVRGMARDHRVNGGLGRPWGDQWQSAMWAGQIGVAAWLIRDNLPGEDRDRVRALLIHEANRFREVPAKASNDKSVKDTKAEELMWNADALLLACLLVGEHEHRPQWYRRAIDYHLTAVATPADLQSERRYDGIPVRERISGYCFTAEHAVGNHGVYPHPGYTASSYISMRPLLHLGELGLRPPAALFHNAEHIYRMFVDHAWPSPPHEAPGGTIYRADGGIYWPISKERNRAGRYGKWIVQDAFADAYGYDQHCSTPAAIWLDQHTRIVLDGIAGRDVPIKLDSYDHAGYLGSALLIYALRVMQQQGTLRQPAAED